MSNRMFPSHDASYAEAILAYQFPWGAHGHCWQRARANAALCAAYAGLVSNEVASRVLLDAKDTLGSDFDLQPLADALQQRIDAGAVDSSASTSSHLSLVTLKNPSHTHGTACDRCESKSCPNSGAARESRAAGVRGGALTAQRATLNPSSGSAAP